jgi:hypothetical protein
LESFNFNLWYDTYDPKFIEICHQSRIPDKWVSYQKINHSKYLGSILKPINQYVEALYPPPKLISLDNNTIRLRQYTHAGIFLLDNTIEFTNVDRPHMRQYYQTKNSYPLKDDCFEPAYLFYVPWAIDEQITARFEQPLEDSSFHIYPSSYVFNKIPESAQYVEPNFVPFKFKKVGKHMATESFGKIPSGSPMFDIVIDSNDILIKRIKEFYEHN